MPENRLEKLDFSIGDIKIKSQDEIQESQEQDQPEEQKQPVVNEHQAPEPQQQPGTPEEHPWVDALKSRGVTDLNAFLSEYEEAKRKASSVPKFDPWMERFYEAYVDKKDVSPFLKAIEFQPDAVGEDDIIRMSVNEEYGGQLSGELLEAAMNQKRIQLGYKEEMTEFEQANFHRLWQLEAQKARMKMSEKYASYRVPEERSPADAANYYMSKINPYLEEQQREFLKRRQADIEQSEAYRKLSTEGMLPLRFRDGSGQERVINYKPGSVNDLVSMANDESKFWDLFNGPDGKPDYQKFWTVVEFAKNPEEFLRTISAPLKAQGAEAILNKVGNPSMPEKRATQDPGDKKPLTPSEEMLDFLEAAKRAKNKK